MRLLVLTNPPPIIFSAMYTALLHRGHISAPPNFDRMLLKLLLFTPGAGDPIVGDGELAPDPPDDGLVDPPFNLGAMNACATAGMLVVGMDPSPVSMDSTPAPPPNPYPFGPNSLP